MCSTDPRWRRARINFSLYVRALCTACLGCGDASSSATSPSQLRRLKLLAALHKHARSCGDDDDIITALLLRDERGSLDIDMRVRAIVTHEL